MSDRDPPGFATGIARIAALQSIGPRRRRVTLAASEISRIDPGDGPAPAVRLLIPPPSEPVVLPTVSIDGLAYPPGAVPPTPRTLTIRRLDREGASLEVDVVTAHAGVASEWATGARVGDSVGFAAPKTFPALPLANHYVLLGDESAIPAIETILELLRRCNESSTAQVVATAAADGRGSGVSDPLVRCDRRRLVEIVEALAPLDEGTVVWIAGEATEVRAARALLRDRRPAPKHVRACGYWRANMSSTAVDDAMLSARQRLVTDGSDLDVLDEFALVVPD